MTDDLTITAFAIAAGFGFVLELLFILYDLGIFKLVGVL